MQLTDGEAHVRTCDQGGSAPAVYAVPPGRSTKSMPLPSGARWPAALVKPRPILAHLRPLRRRRITFARRGLFALRRGPPTQFHAVVRVVSHLEVDRALGYVAQRERPWRPIGARIRHLAGRELGREHALKLCLHLGDAFPRRHRIALGAPRDAIRE